MTEHPAADRDRLLHAVTQLVTAFEQLGAEHKALVAEVETTAAKERRGTVNRMAEAVAQAGHTLSRIVNMLATVHGLKSMGIDRQFSKDADGGDYSPLNSLGHPGETLYEAAGYLQAVAHTLGKAYTPTRKHPALARARCPQHLGTALTSLRAALESVCADLADDQDVEAVTEYASTLAYLTELKDRVCRTVPAQGAWPSSKHVLVSTELWRGLLDSGMGHVERDVAMWLMLQTGQQQRRATDEIAAQLDYEQSQVDEALEKLRKAGVLGDDGTVLGVHYGPAPV
ncbi:hypothetical protein [Streptomyces rubradiris]|uniref:Uncharacterized protein n=1 Tax=Streptomyces rubradiris TaxID=285531 RepID=A0ABQ3RAC5_STRRR|nr:hypothetical protein [Streptomyces rubradiris]GHH26064.1 hypothetical protein GCM10018792_66060 [Streptomyces rubradiris]GHI52811.1 hypothetical protein Srubr_26570 [Streptomyces rubradiris]